ncbi:MAG: hypothetical protein EBU23_06985 [Mycobacteriaceae bacterium]|nr:hypothetical protein [Mycobacteriaceae bacterium]
MPRRRQVGRPHPRNRVGARSRSRRSGVEFPPCSSWRLQTSSSGVLVTGWYPVAVNIPAFPLTYSRHASELRNFRHFRW